MYSCMNGKDVLYVYVFLSGWMEFDFGFRISSTGRHPTTTIAPTERCASLGTRRRVSVGRSVGRWIGRFVSFR